MESTEFLAKLDDQDWQVCQSAGDHVVLMPPDPIEADELWPVSSDEAPYYDAIDELGIRTVIEFWWDDGMPASTAGIAVFDTEPRSYVSLEPDPDLERGWLVIAAIQPAKSKAGFAAFLVDYLSTNGGGYGAEIFGGLPNRIENHDPGMVTQATVREAIAAWADW